MQYYETMQDEGRYNQIWLPIAPPRVDKQLGWVVRNPRFRSNLTIQPIKKSNGGSHLSARHQKFRFNLIWAFSEWLEHEILKIWDFWKMSGSHFSKTRKKKCFENAPFCPVLLKKTQKMVFWKCPHLSGSNFSKTHKKWCLKKISFVRIQIPTFSLPWNYFTYMGRWISKSL